MTGVAIGSSRWRAGRAGPGDALDHLCAAPQDQTPWNIAHHVLVAVFLAFAILTILRGIFDDDIVRTDHLIGTVCGYLLAGVAWGNSYLAADLIRSDAFRLTPEIAAQTEDDHLRTFYFNYFSLCALTGAGFGDITPVRPFVATLSWLESAFGQFYIAIVVAQLVSMKFAQSAAAAGRSSDP